MAKTKDEVKTETVPEVHPDTLKVQKLEALLMDALPELWRFRRILNQNDAHKQAGVSAGDIYVKFRDAVGEYGQQMDAFLRGVGPEPKKT
jgi:hypothetical protein